MTKLVFAMEKAGITILVILVLTAPLKSFAQSPGQNDSNNYLKQDRIKGMDRVNAGNLDAMKTMGYSPPPTQAEIMAQFEQQRTQPPIPDKRQ